MRISKFIYSSTKYEFWAFGIRQVLESKVLRDRDIVAQTGSRDISKIS
jgi:hypothetical protein